MNSKSGSRLVNRSHSPDSWLFVRQATAATGRTLDVMWDSSRKADKSYIATATASKSYRVEGDGCEYIAVIDCIGQSVTTFILGEILLNDHNLLKSSLLLLVIIEKRGLLIIIELHLTFPLLGHEIDSVADS